MRRGLLVGLLTVIVACVGWVAHWGYVVLTTDPAETGLAYSSTVQVASSYTDITNGSGSGDSCHCVQRWFVGPSDADPLTVLIAPRVVWTTASTARAPGDPVGWSPVAYGDVTTPDSGHCDLSITRESAEYLPLKDGTMEMTPAQFDGWTDGSGSLTVLELDIFCDRDADRFG